MKPIEWTPKALRQIRKIKNRETQIMIYDAVDTLKSFPKCRNTKKLKDRDEYRLRVGQWRVIFADSIYMLRIEEIKKRDEHTY